MSSSYAGPDVGPEMGPKPGWFWLVPALAIAAIAVFGMQENPPRLEKLPADVLLILQITGVVVLASSVGLLLGFGVAYLFHLADRLSSENRRDREARA